MPHAESASQDQDRDRQRHRGAHPEDARLFTDSAVAKLRLAQQEAAYLRGRGYSLDTILTTVGGHHQLEARQRLALQRAVCSAAQKRERQARALTAAQAAGAPWEIDGFNLIITLEVALSGGLLLACADGALRDLAGLRGSYHPVEETETALTLIGEAIAARQPPSVRFWLDAPVSNSGRLRARILHHAATWASETEVELVPDADRALVGRERVVSGDSLVIDACASWLNLAAELVATRVPKAWLIPLDVTEVSQVPGISGTDR